MRQLDFIPQFQQMFSGKVSQRIFFLHIHKCAGRSLKQAIQNSFGLKANLGKGSFWSIHERTAHECSEMSGERDRDSYKSKLLFYFMHHDQYRYIAGHFTYSEEIYKHFGEKWNFVTNLRDPVERFFSHYFYLSSTERYYRSSLDCDLSSYLDSEAAIKQGRKFIISLTDGIDWEEAASDAAINQAIENLNKFKLVGTLERLDLFRENYHRLFGAKLLIPKLNVNQVSKSKKQGIITGEIRKKVEEICYPDIQVYQYLVKKGSILMP